jgi:hypothetical protein
MEHGFAFQSGVERSTLTVEEEATNHGMGNVLLADTISDICRTVEILN